MNEATTTLTRADTNQLRYEKMNTDLDTLTRAEVCEAINCSSRKLGYLLAKNQFPKGFGLGKSDLWSKQAVSNWYRTQFAAQEAWRPIQAR